MAVYNNDRPSRTGPQAIHRLQGEFLIPCGLARVDSQLTLEFLPDLWCPSDMTSRAHAYRANMLPSGFQAERLVECGHAVDVNQRLAGRVGYRFQGLGGQIAVLRLDLLQNRNQPATITLVLVQDSEDFRLLRLVSRRNVLVFSRSSCRFEWGYA